MIKYPSRKFLQDTDPMDECLRFCSVQVSVAARTLGVMHSVERFQNVGYEVFRFFQNTFI